MARLARLVVPGLPHHITQRGNRRQQTFFCDEDYAAYVELMADWCGERGVEIWAYCLMPNHVHLIAVPQSEDGLGRAIGEAHRRYTRRINFREKWRGYLWQGRFASFVMDEPYLLAAARYVEWNPVRAGLAVDAADWPWSSAKAHLSGRDDRPDLLDILTAPGRITTVEVGKKYPLCGIYVWAGLENTTFDGQNRRGAVCQVQPAAEVEGTDYVCSLARWRFSSSSLARSCSSVVAGSQW